MVEIKSLKKLDLVIDELNLLKQTIENEEYNKVIKKLNDVYSDLERDVYLYESTIEEMEEEVYTLRNKGDYFLEYYDDEL